MTESEELDGCHMALESPQSRLNSQPCMEDSDFFILETSEETPKDDDVKETAIDSTLKTKSSSSNNLLDSEDCAHGMTGLNGSETEDDSNGIPAPTYRAFVQFSISENENTNTQTPNFGISKFITKYLSFLRQGKQ